MNDITCDCTDPRPFPAPYATISLTNYIELIKVNQLYNPTTNHGEIVRQTIPPKRIKEVVSAFNIFSSVYDAYYGIRWVDRFQLIPVLYTDYLQPHSAYFFINKSLNKPRAVLETRCLAIWRARYGAVVQGNVYFPPDIIEHAYEMPSRVRVYMR